MGVGLSEGLPSSASSAVCSYDTCGRPLRYYWRCTSNTSTICPDFMAAANASDNQNPTPILDLQEFDVISIGLKVCVAGTNECSLPLPVLVGINDWSVVDVYEGAPVHEAHIRATSSAHEAERAEPAACFQMSGSLGDAVSQRSLGAFMLLHARSRFLRSLMREAGGGRRTGGSFHDNNPPLAPRSQRAAFTPFRICCLAGAEGPDGRNFRRAGRAE